MTTLTAKAVYDLLGKCLFADGEDQTEYVEAECILNTYRFHPGRLEASKQEIGDLLSQLPDEFQLKGGGGWSFLSAHITRAGDQWAEHQNIEQLLALGIASQQAKMVLPRAMWHILPGGMPYFVVSPGGFPIIPAINPDFPDQNL